MKRSLPPLNALRAFEVAARTGGFTKAAGELLVSQGAISRHVALLEYFLGVTLFHRSHRQVQLTQEGHAYASAVRIALDQIEQATRDVRATRLRRSLHIKVYSTLAICWLVPRLGQFHALYPEMAVTISSSPAPADLALEDVMFTIDHGTDRMPWARYDPLFRAELMPVCSPALLNGPNPIKVPGDLLNHVLLSSLNRPNDWQLWLEGVGITDHGVGIGLTFSNSSLAYEAAANGIGVAMAQAHYVENEIEIGRLVAPFKQRALTGSKYYLVSRWSDATVPETVAFRDWMILESGKSSTAFSEED